MFCAEKSKDIKLLSVMIRWPNSPYKKYNTPYKRCARA